MMRPELGHATTTLPAHARRLANVSPSAQANFLPGSARTDCAIRRRDRLFWFQRAQVNQYVRRTRFCVRSRSGWGATQVDANELGSLRSAPVRL